MSMNEPLSEPKLSTDIESRVLGLVLMKSERMSTVLSAGIIPEMFFERRHQTLFAKMCELHEKKQPFDVFVLVDYMGAELSEECGGLVYLDKICSEPTDAYLPAWLDRMLKNYAKLNIQASCTFMSSDSLDDNYIEEAEKHVDECKKLIALSKGKKCKTFGEYIDESTQMVKDMSLNQDSHIVSYYIHGMDARFTHKRGEKHYLMALPGTGKTSMALSLIDQHIQNNVKHVLFCNETSTADLLNRLKVIHGNISSRILFRMGSRGASDVQRYAEADKWVRQYADSFRIFGQGTYEHSVNGIDARLKELADSGWNPDFVSIDYIQNMKATGISQKLPRTQQLEDIALGIADLIPKYNVAGLILSQVNRDKDRDKGTRKFLMSDIKGSSAIEQSADHITAIQFKANEHDCRLLMWYHLKIRGSGEIDVLLKFNPDNGRFTGVSDGFN